MGEGAGEDAIGELSLVGAISSMGMTSTTAATTAMITTPRKAMSQRTIRTLPFLRSGGHKLLRHTGAQLLTPAHASSCATKRRAELGQ